MDSDTWREVPQSLSELRERLERLPVGHPSSPYNSDGSRKPPPPDLTRYELPLPDEPGWQGEPVPDHRPDEESAEDHPSSTTSRDDQDLAKQDAEDQAHTLPDGSWEWKTCHLTPEQALAGDRGLERCREVEGRDLDGKYGEHGTTPAMWHIETQLEHGRLVERTEEFALKSPDRFKEKLANLIGRYPNADVRDLVNSIHDGIRYTFIFDFYHYTEGTEFVQGKISDAGYTHIETRPKWDGDEYKGVNSRWREPSRGVVFEVQFHTRESWEAKQKTHEAYEKIGDPRTSVEEVERLRAYQRKVCASVPVPSGGLEIRPYKKKE